MAKTALILSGGGARGAYQAGVVRGIQHIATSIGIKRPFSGLSGVSAGAINTVYLAAYADDPAGAVERLAEFWAALRTEDVFRTDFQSISRIAWRWARHALLGGVDVGRRPNALLDTAPLGRLLEARVPFDRIGEHLKSGFLDNVSLSATDYASVESVAFFMDATGIPSWRKSRRVGVRHAIGVRHTLASAALPLLFPPVVIGNRAYGDGCLRNTAPLSSALHLGADRLIVVGVRKAAPNLTGESLDDAFKAAPGANAPNTTAARVLGVIINAIMLDAVDIDLERLSRINKTLSLIAQERLPESGLRKIDWLYIRPSEDIAGLAAEETKSMPALLKYLVSGLGSLEEAADLISYLLFEPSFTRRLIDLGYKDAMARKDEIEAFFSTAAAL